MALDFKKILALGGGIAATVATGGVTAPALIGPILGLASEFIPGEDPEKAAQEAALDGWERVMIAGWVETYRRFMDIPMSLERKQETIMGKLRSDFIMNYADMPDEKWVKGVYTMLAMAVTGQMAAEA